MDFTFSPIRTQLRAAVRAFLDKRIAQGVRARRWPSTTTPASRPTCGAQIVELGWTGLLVPEERGGLGLGIVDAVVVQEEMGRSRVPRPVLLVRDPGDARGARARPRRSARRRSASGHERGTVALDEAGSGDPLDRVRVRANGRGNRYTLDGVKPMVHGRPHRRLGARAGTHA